MSKLNRLRAQAFRNQGGRCYYCDLPMWLRTPPVVPVSGSSKYFASEALRCTAEHLVARCDGGTDNPENIAAACLLCNRRRHRRKCALSAEGFRQLVQRRMQQGKWHFREDFEAHTS